MGEDDDRRRLAATFDTAAGLYRRARPRYPDELFDHLVAVTGLAQGARLLEIGCGTGAATVPLARRGFSLTCLEPGAALAAIAREEVAGLDVEVVGATLEGWDGAGTPYALGFAATSWHWTDPAVRWSRVAQALADDGHLAYWTATHVLSGDEDPFFDDLQEVYVEIGEGLPQDTPVPRASQLPDDRAQIEASGLFDVVDVRRFAWDVTYDADGYLDLLDTFSGHIAMQPWQRERLHGEIRRRLAARPDGLLRRGWGCVLHVARVRRRPRPGAGGGAAARPGRAAGPPSGP